MTRWQLAIEPVTSPDADRRRPRDRGGVVHQPLDARDVPRRARERGRVVLLPGVRRRGARRSASARSGASSTSCTSTTWRSCRTGAARASARALLTYVLDEGARLGADARDARSAAVERCRRDCLYERFGFTVAGVRRGYYTQPVEDALVLWREDLSVRPLILNRPGALCYVSPYMSKRCADHGCTSRTICKEAEHE